MTEKRGGSDVGRGTETLAVAQPEGSYKLYGYKWFSSATDSDMTLTLARVVDQDGTFGSFFLSLTNVIESLNRGTGVKTKNMVEQLCWVL